jgi:hypothetical protein
MKLHAAHLRLSATDLSNHLACRHLTVLDLLVARGEKQEPAWAAPHLVMIRELGQQHEAAYLNYLAKQKGIAVENLASVKGETTLLEETLRLMQQGAEVIAQGALANGNWFGPHHTVPGDRSRPYPSQISPTRNRRRTRTGTAVHPWPFWK